MMGLHKKYNAMVYLPGWSGTVRRTVVLEEDYDQLRAELSALKAGRGEAVACQHCEGSGRIPVTGRGAAFGVTNHCPHCVAPPAAPEPILVEAVAVTKANEDGELYLDWLLEGGIAALEFAGAKLLVAHGQVTDDCGSGEVYTAPPATEVIVPREIPEKWESRLSRFHPTVESGKWPKRWADEAIQQELQELRTLLAQSQEVKP